MNSKSLNYLIHGFPDSSEVWNDLQPELSGEVLKFHLPELKVRSSGELIACHLAQLKPYVDQGYQVNIIAHDLGVPQAWMIAPYLKDQLKSMVLINGFSVRQILRKIKSTPEQAKRSWYMSVFVIPGAVKVFLLLRGRKIFSQLRRLGWKGQESDFEMSYLYRILGELKSVKETPIKAPVLQISSTKDPFLLPATVQDLEKSALHFELEIWEGGHWIIHEQAKKLGQKLRHFQGALS